MRITIWGSSAYKWEEEEISWEGSLDEKCREMRIDAWVTSTFKGQVEEEVPRWRHKTGGEL